MKDPHEENIQRLRQIEKAIGNIKAYVEGETRESFCSLTMLHDAVLMQFVITGEAITHIDNVLLEKYDYPWYKVKSFRNLIAHEYFNIKLEAVWMIIENELPELEKLINKIIELESRLDN
jgi:uncharacterized protein with HEPN domain